MKHIFLDTNFVVDYLLREEYKDICKEFLSVGVKNKCVFYISALTIANFAYIARNASKDELYNYLTL